jgi:hypothetical protein
MPYLEGTSSIQKIIIVLFAATIALSCLSLIGIAIEKPDKVSTLCEHTGGLRDMKSVGVNFTDIKDDGLMIVPNCTTTVNPPMSNGLSTMINIAMICAGFFIIAAVIAYITRKKEEPEPEEDDQIPQQ